MEPLTDAHQKLPAASRAAAGHFSVEGRRTAVSAALPLVATYFRQTGDQQFDRQGGLNAGRYDTAHQELLNALRLRVAMASAPRIVEAAQSVLRRPNFRYGLVREEQVGALRGRLDSRAFIASLGRTHAVPRFPVISVRRRLSTPENVLVTAAVLQVLRELRAPLARNLPMLAPDRRRATRLARELEHFLRTSQFEECTAAALDSLRRGRIGALTDTVRRRLVAGHVGNPEPYEKVVEWVSRGIDGIPAVDTGELEWDFYDSTFDTTLFEIWCLSALKDKMTGKLGPVVDESRLLVGVNSPVATWRSGSARVDLFFQREPQTIDRAITPRWQGSGRKISGRPDITVMVSTDGNSRMTFLDPKLRQRANSEPTEELYKILGYFNNFKLDGDGRGGILYYAPQPQNLGATEYTAAEHGGRLLSVALDPERTEASDDDWDEVLRLILDPAPAPAPAPARDDATVDSFPANEESAA